MESKKKSTDNTSVLDNQDSISAGQGKIKIPLSTHFWLTIERVDQSFILKPFNLKLTDYVILVQFPSSSTTVPTIPTL